MPAETLNNPARMGLALFGSLILITVTTPWIGLLIFAIVAVRLRLHDLGRLPEQSLSIQTFCVVQFFYTKTSSQLRRLDLGSRTPLYNLLTDTFVHPNIHLHLISHFH